MSGVKEQDMRLRPPSLSNSISPRVSAGLRMLIVVRNPIRRECRFQDESVIRQLAASGHEIRILANRRTTSDRGSIQRRCSPTSLISGYGPKCTRARGAIWRRSLASGSTIFATSIRVTRLRHDRACALANGCPHCSRPGSVAIVGTCGSTGTTSRGIRATGGCGERRRALLTALLSS